ncbi:MAG: M20 family metallo-hydrolase [Solirubrobacterales bacterium]
MTEPPNIDAQRVIAELRELARRTSDERGAQRIAWGETWRDARAYCAELLAELGIEPERDPAGNVWARLEGADPEAPPVAIGSHLDSVPDGGWLDGALGVIAGVGVLRAWAATDRPPPRPLWLVDWADEEGARFGRSLFGSSAWTGTFDPSELEAVRDAGGELAEEVLAANGVVLGELGDPLGERPSAYLELHIEQGPVLEAEGHAVSAVAGCAGVERRRLRFHGQASHAGTTPMDVRRDPGLAAFATALDVERVARQHEGVGTTGTLALRPGIPTAVPATAELVVDLRHRDSGELEAMLDEVIDFAREASEARGCEASDEEVWRIEPIPFDPELVSVTSDVVVGAGGRPEPLTSGALHDAAEVARVLPAAMMFCPSRGGLSHTSAEDTDEADLELAITAFGDLVARILSL